MTQEQLKALEGAFRIKVAEAQTLFLKTTALTTAEKATLVQLKHELELLSVVISFGIKENRLVPGL